ncbi:MAG: hypothetical protein VX012_08555 [Planctomycetota bacterium]|nr:hypothetical protein [Planctomycetota bacterium]
MTRIPRLSPRRWPGGGSSPLPALILVVAVAVVACTPFDPPRPAARDAIPVGENAGLGVEFGPDDVQVEPWSFGDYEGSLITTPTHLLHVTLPDGSLRQNLPIFTNRALDHYRTMIPTPSRPTERMTETLEAVEPTVASKPLPAPTERMSSVVFDTRPQWAAWTQRRLGRQAGLYLAIERGGYTIDAESVLWDIGRYDTLCMLAHEGWHQYTQTVFRHPLPTFLEEGLAAYAEGHSFRRRDTEPRFMPWRNLERYGQLRGADYRNRLIDLDELVSKPPQSFVSAGERSLLTYYAQVWALVHYLVEGRDGAYLPGLDKLLRDAAEGRIATSLYDADRSAGRRGRLLGPNAGRAIIATYFDRDYARFKAGYEDFIQKVVARGNGTRIWQGRSPLLAD